MRIRHYLSIVLLFICGLTYAQNMTLPMDTAVRMGKLANGLTYYIRYNNWPEHRANFYIAQRVGSIQEEESQRGLAHFLEHMAFNGSDNFKDDALLRYCESIGVQFGGDLNAYTSIDRTVYNIDNVPTTRQQSLDSCLLILRDWSCGLTLDPKEIDKERGVIHEEWRLRTSAQSRMLERNLPALYPGSKYGVRYPIGLMSVVDNFKPKELVDYYHKWYHPSNQAIIIVGDVDVNHVEAEIKRLFSGIKNPEHEAPVVDEPVPDNAEPIVIADKDKETQVPLVLLLKKQEAFPDSLKNTPVYYITKYLTNAISSMLSQRMSEATKKADCPYVQASAGYDNYLFSKTKDALEVDIVPRDQSLVNDALKAGYEELRRASEFGFTATEYKRFQNDYLADLDKRYSNKDKRTTKGFCQELISNYLDHEPVTDFDTYYQMMKQVVPMMPVDAINQTMKEMFTDNDSNLVVISFNVEKEGNTYPTKESLLKAIADARTANVTAYVDNVKNEPLIKQDPTPGKIVKEEKNDKFGFTTLTLSNGVKVNMKKTDFKKDQVIVSGRGGAGESIYDPKKEGANLLLFDGAIENSGLGNFSNTELEKALSGVIASASLSMGRKFMTIQGNSTPKDLRALFQLIYLNMTNIKKDQESWESYLKEEETMLKNRDANPQQAFSDSLTATLYGHDPYMRPLTHQDLTVASYDRILQMAKERTANAQGWSFNVIGNFDEDSLRQFVCTYLGSLPSQKKNVSGKYNVTYQKGDINNIFKRKMETPKSIAIIVWNNRDMAYTTERSVQADIAGQILTMEMLKTIREDSSAAYSCGAQGSAEIGYDNHRMVSILAYCPMKPEKADVALRIMNAEVPELAQKVDADKLDKVKKLMLKQADDNAKSNSYWMAIIDQYVEFGVDDYTDYKKIVEAQTPETIQNFMKEFLKSGDRIEVAMLPEE